MNLLRVILIAFCLTGAGCKSGGQKPPAHRPTTPKDGAPSTNPFWSDDPSVATRPRDTPGERSPASPEFSGILAGTVVDASNHPLPGVVVNFTEATAAPGSAAKGTETDAQGIFMIKGLKPETAYMLTFRGDDHGRVLGGAAQVKPPNSHMLIRVTEGNVTTLTPPAQPHPGTTGPYAPKDPAKDPPPAKAQPALEPVPPTEKDPLTEGEDYSPLKNPPASRTFPPPPSTKPAPTNNNVAIDPNNPPVPALVIPGPPTSAPAPPKYMEPAPSNSPVMSAEPARSSPIHQVTMPPIAPRQRSQTKVEFTLRDLIGRPWSFRNHSGKVVLIDFWSTGCTPCLKAIPKMVDLQSRYGQDGLEVVGIACEDPKTAFTDQIASVHAVKVRFAETKTPINYSLYLEGSGNEGVVQKQFHVERYPTMILLDDVGRELWRSDRKETSRLEDAVKYYLSR